MTTRRDITVTLGLAVVALTAIIASFGTLAGLAQRVGWGEWASWLLPCCIDALALSAGRVWLSAHASPGARRYARAVSLTAVAGSVAGNAIGHLLSTGILTTAGTAGTVLVIVVGAVPAIALTAVGHLVTLAGAPAGTEPPTGTRRRTEPGTGTRSVTNAGPTETLTGTTTGTRGGTEPRTWTATGTVAGSNAGPTGTAPAQATRESRPRRAGTSTGTRSPKRDKARDHWLRERAAGRTPSGAELARAAGADPTMGNRWLREWTAEARVVITVPKTP